VPLSPSNKQYNLVRPRGSDALQLGR